ncbi:MAG: N-acetyltransferase family protein [Demequina sp.]
MTASAVREATAGDAPRMAQIYQYYVRETVVTFELDDVPEDVMAVRAERVQQAGRPWLVIETDSVVQGFAYAAPFRDRTAYQHSVETSVYLDQSALRKGLGMTIYGAVIDRLRGTDVHAAVALVALPNAGSVALHERLGFVHAGTLRQVGRKFDQWIDVGYWQLTLTE